MGRDEKRAPLKTPAWEASGTKTHRDFFASRAASQPENLVPLPLKTAVLM